MSRDFTGQGGPHYFLARHRRRNTPPETHRKHGPNAPGRSAGLLGDRAAWPADLRTLQRGLARGEWYLEPANCRLSSCCERKYFSDDQSAARSRFNVPPFSTPPSRLTGSYPLLPASALPGSALPGHRRPRSRLGVRPRPLLTVWPAQRLVSLGLEPWCFCTAASSRPRADLNRVWAAERLVTVGH